LLIKLSHSAVAAVLLLAMGLVSGVLRTPFANSASANGKAQPEIVFVEAPRVVGGELTKRFPQGSRLVRLAPGASPRSVINLTPELFGAADPQISFDATKILFSGLKSPSARWQIWEMNTDGSDKLQLTHCSGDCLRPAYLPRKQIVFTVITGKGSQRTSALYVSQRSGADAHPVTFGPGNFQVETVLRSGRVLVSAESPLLGAGKGLGASTFFVMMPDGTGLSLFRWDVRRNLVRTGAEELDDGTVLFVERRYAAGRETGGELAWIRPGALHNSLITPPQSAYWSAHELQGNTLVVAKQDSGSSASNGKFDLYTFDLKTKTPGQLIYRNQRFASVQAVPLEPQSVPQHYWSILHPEEKTGRLICLNAYLSADAPHARFTGHIARVRVITLEQDENHERVLGEAPVQTDGSFYIVVPADQPVRFELLSAKGSVIHVQKSWIWVRPGEDRGCLGCHESPALAPENHWPLALRRFDTPTPLGMPFPSQPIRHH